MTIKHDPDPDATVKMPRPTAPKKEDETALEEVDPDSTLIRDDWGNLVQPPGATPKEPETPSAVPQQQKWERTLRRPAYVPKQESR